MVGITGYVDFSMDSVDAVDLVERMASHLKYTGNEATETWSEGSLTCAGVQHGTKSNVEQPIWDDEQNVSIAMVGEVFNYADHRSKLEAAGYEFDFPNDDAEFCLKYYLEEGIAGFQSLNGTFSLVINDRRREEIHLVTDRFAAIPLYYHEGDDQLLFGNSVSAFSEWADIDPTLDKDAVLEFFTFQRTFGDKTYYKEVKMIPPGSAATITRDGIEFNQYWELEYEYEDKSRAEFAEDLADAIVYAVDRRTQDGLNYGVFLSGGLDSRAILAGFLQHNVDVTTFTFGGDRYADDDLRVAKKVAMAAGVDHKVVEPAEEILDGDLLEELAHIGDGMHRIDHGPMREYIDNVSGIDVGFHGLELDYTIGGIFIRSKSISVFGNEYPLPIPENVSSEDHASGIKSQLGNTVWADLDSDRFFANLTRTEQQTIIDNTIKEVLAELGDGAEDVNSSFEYFWYSPAYKSHVHLNESSVRTRLPTRPIVYDTELFERYLEIPPKHRYNRKVLSEAIKIIDADLAAVENSNTGYPADIPRTRTWLYQAKDVIVEGLKSRYTNDRAPKYSGLGTYIRESPRLQDLLQEIIHDPEAINPDMFDVNELERCYAEHLSGESDNLDALMKVLTFGLWHRKFGPSNVS